MKNLTRLLILIIGMNLVFQFHQSLYGQANELTSVGVPINEYDTSGYSPIMVVFIAFISLLAGGCFAVALFLYFAQKETLPVLAKIENVFNFFRHARHARNRIKKFFSYQHSKDTEVMGSE